MNSADGVLTLSIPAGAVAADTDFTITPITNTAPGGQGSAYRLGPDGLLLLAPATVAFQVSAIAAPIDQLTVGFQDGSAYWLRLPTARDPASTTIQASVSHLGDWAASTGTSPRDLFRIGDLLHHVDIPFSATGTATLNYVGEDSRAAYYLAGGTMTLPPSAPPWPSSSKSRQTSSSPSTRSGTSSASMARGPPWPPPSIPRA